MPMYKLSNSMGNMALGENGDQRTDADKNEEEEEEEEEDEEEEEEEEEDDGIADFTPPKYLPEEKPKTPVIAPPTPLSMRKVIGLSLVSEFHRCLFRAPNRAIRIRDQRLISNANRVFWPIDAGSISPLAIKIYLPFKMVDTVSSPVPPMKSSNSTTDYPIMIILNPIPAWVGHSN